MSDEREKKDSLDPDLSGNNDSLEMRDSLDRLDSLDKVDELISFERLLRLSKKDILPPDIYFNIDFLNLLGTTLGHYHIDGRIGAGGMGMVYKATDIKLGRIVALKALPPNTARKKEWQKLIEREAQAAAIVNHPNVAAVYELGEDQDLIYIAMEYVEGHSLRKLIPEKGMALEQALGYAKQIAAGLAHAHKMGIIHRDLKPENIMINHEKMAKILDFGLAKQLRLVESEDPVTPPMRVASLTVGGRGTPRYMAPEQWKQGQVTPATDIWAFGVLFFEMLTGSNPDLGALTLDFPRTTPAEVQEIIRCCLQQSPDQRYADGEALVKALQIETQNKAKFSRKRVFLLGMVLVAFVLVFGGLKLNSLLSEKKNILQKTSIVKDIKKNANQTAEKGPTLKQLTFNSEEARVLGAAISPDGTLLAFIARFELFINDTRSGISRLLQTKPKINAQGVRWYPDGKKLLVSTPSNYNEKNELWSVNIQTGEATPISFSNLLKDQFNPYEAVVSPNNNYIAAISKKDILLLDVKKHTLEVLLKNNNYPSAYLGYNLSWSPDSKYIAFSKRYITVDKTASIERIDISSKKVDLIVSDITLYQNATGYIVFHWMPDWGFVFALTPTIFEPERSILWHLNTSPKTGKPNTKPVPLPFYSNFSVGEITTDNSGKMISFIGTESQEDVFLGDLKDHGKKLVNFKRLTFSNNDESVSDWSLDNQALLINYKLRNRYGCYIQRLDSSIPIPLLSEKFISFEPINTPNDEGILFWKLMITPNSLSRNISLMFLPKLSSTAKTLFSSKIIGHENDFGYPQNIFRVRCARKANRCFLSKRNDERLIFKDLNLSNGEFKKVGSINGKWTKRNCWEISPDGKSIAIAFYNKIGIFSLSGTLEKILTSSNGCIYQFVTWDNLRNGLYATSMCPKMKKFYNLFYISLKGKEYKLWSSLNSWMSDLKLSHDGTKLAVTLTRFKSDVWSLENF